MINGFGKTCSTFTLLGFWLMQFDHLLNECLICLEKILLSNLFSSFKRFHFQTVICRKMATELHCNKGQGRVIMI